MRALSAGVSVNDTKSDIMMATAVVMPKLWKKRPMRPSMNATGRKMITSDRVVAMTASAISAVPRDAAVMASSPSSWMRRKMFSRTTTASSITMPTASTSASIVRLFSVKSNARMSVNVAMIEVGMASPATIVLRQSRMNSSTVNATSTAPSHRCVLHGVDGAVDEARLVAHHLQVDVRGQDGAELVELRLHAVDHLHRVGARLLADDELDRVLAVQPGEAARLDDAVLGVAEVTHVERPPAHVRHDEVVEIAHRLDASHRAHGQLAARLIEPPAGQLDVLRAMASRTWPTDSPWAVRRSGSTKMLIARSCPPRRITCPTPGMRLDDLLDLPARQLGHLPQAAAAGDGDGHDGDGIDVELVDHRRVGARSGSWARTDATLSRTSCAATSLDFSRTKLTTIDRDALARRAA